MSQQLEQKLIAHISSDERDFEYIKETMNRIEASQNKAETNHWAHVQASTGALEEKYGDLHKDVQDLVKAVTAQGADMAWIKKFFWIVASASVLSLLEPILSLVTKKL